jgi:hypothetical protein
VTSPVPVPNREREKRVERAVLEDEFTLAAKAYARVLVRNERVEHISIREIMRARERFTNAFCMLETTDEQS